MSKTTVTIGHEYEQSAKAYLLKQGLEYVEENFSCSCGEIDLIMRDGEYYVFVEVRFRKSSSFGSSIETITRSKQLKIIRAATYYLQQQQLFEKVDCRFDVVGMTQDDRIDWIRDAFSVTY